MDEIKIRHWVASANCILDDLVLNTPVLAGEEKFTLFRTCDGHGVHVCSFWFLSELLDMVEAALEDRDREQPNDWTAELIKVFGLIVNATPVKSEVTIDGIKILESEI